MTAIAYKLLVDWDGDGLFTSPDEDVTADTLYVECARGRDYASQLTGRSIAGRLTATLRNETGKYNSFNAASPIAGSVVPKRKVQLRASTGSFPYTFPITFEQPLWTGFLDTVIPQPAVGGVHRATLTAMGPLAIIAEKRVRVAMQTNVRTDVAVGLVLDDAGWPAADRNLDAGQTTMARWWAGDLQDPKADVDALLALRELEDTEGGFIVETSDGKIAFESRHHRLLAPHTVSQATYSDAAGALLPYVAIEQKDPLREIYNLMEAEVRRYITGTFQVLWTHPESGEDSPALVPGQTRVFLATYPNASAPAGALAVDTWLTPEAYTDYTANSKADGTGTDYTTSVSITTAKFSNVMGVVVTNNAPVRVFLTKLQARGTPVLELDRVKVVSEDAASQAKYGKRSYPNRGPYIPNTREAQDWADFWLSVYKDPVPVVEVTLAAHSSSALAAEALARQVSDRVTLVATNNSKLGISEDFFVEAVYHTIKPKEHFVRFALSPASAFGGFWVLDVSRLGLDSRVAY